MKPYVFQNSPRSWGIASLLGILAGVLVWFFSRFPADGLWGLAYFSSMSFGFWMFTSALMALFSGTKLSAAVNVGLYICFMFYVTGIFKQLVVVQNGYNDMAYFARSFLTQIPYGLIPGLICAGLAWVLHSGRGSSLWGKILRYAPAAYLAFETVGFGLDVALRREHLFICLLDAVCLAVYLIIIRKAVNAR